MIRKIYHNFFIQTLETSFRKLYESKNSTPPNIDDKPLADLFEKNIITIEHDHIRSNSAEESPRILETLK